MGNYACILVSNFSESGVWWVHHRIGDAENETHNFADLILLCPGSVVLAQKFDVKIVDRKENETDYSYPVQAPFSGHNGALGNDERAFVVIYQSRTMGPSRRWGTQLVVIQTWATRPSVFFALVSGSSDAREVVHDSSVAAQLCTLLAGDAGNWLITNV
jgi:hypothetical protein